MTLAKTRDSLGSHSPNSRASSSLTSDIFSLCLRVVTNKCPGESGIISRNAMHRGVLRTTNADGVVRSGFARDEDGG